MRNVLVYHNPKAMGYPVGDVTDPVIVTNKAISQDAIGDRVWLITGEGQPRRYYVCGSFIVTEVDTKGEEGFRTRISGAKWLTRTRAEIGTAPWFADLRRSQGNFAFGYQTIADPRFVEGLISASEAVSSSAPTRRRPNGHGTAR